MTNVLIPIHPSFGLDLPDLEPLFSTAMIPTELNVPMMNVVITQCLAKVLNVVIAALPSRANSHSHSVIACHCCIYCVSRL